MIPWVASWLSVYSFLVYIDLINTVLVLYHGAEISSLMSYAGETRTFLFLVSIIDFILYRCKVMLSAFPITLPNHSYRYKYMHICIFEECVVVRVVQWMWVANWLFHFVVNTTCLQQSNEEDAMARIWLFPLWSKLDESMHWLVIELLSAGKYLCIYYTNLVWKPHLVENHFYATIILLGLCMKWFMFTILSDITTAEAWEYHRDARCIWKSTGVLCCDRICAGIYDCIIACAYSFIFPVWSISALKFCSQSIWYRS